MLTPEFIARVKRELDSGMSRVDVETSMRIAGLEAADIANVFAVIGPVVPSAMPGLIPVPPPEPVPVQSPQVPPPTMVTKMPDVPAQSAQTMPIATEVEILAPSINPSITKSAVSPPAPAAPPRAAIPGSMTMPSAPPTPPPQTQEVSMSQTTTMMPKKSSHHLGMIIGIFCLLLVVAFAGACGYAYMEKIGPFAQEQTYSQPQPLSGVPTEASSTRVSTTTIITAATTTATTTEPSAMKVDTTGWKAYATPTAPGGFQFDYPKDWKLTDEMYAGKTDRSIILSSNKTYNLTTNTPDGQISIESRIDKSCLDFGKPITISAEKALLLDWNNHGSLNGPFTKELCLLKWEGLTILASTHSTSTQQIEDTIISTFRVIQPNPPAKE